MVLLSDWRCSSTRLPQIMFRVESRTPTPSDWKHARRDDTIIFHFDCFDCMIYCSVDRKRSSCWSQIKIQGLCVWRSSLMMSSCCAVMSEGSIDYLAQKQSHIFNYTITDTQTGYTTLCNNTPSVELMLHKQGGVTPTAANCSCS